MERFIYKYINSNTYVYIEDREALVVDPHEDSQVLSFMRKEGVTKVLAVLTHEHFDHTCGLPALVEAFETRVVAQRSCAKSLAKANSNTPWVMVHLFRQNGSEKDLRFADELERDYVPYSYVADVTFESSMNYLWHDHRLKFVHTPGHSKGGACILFDDQYVFTGDTLIPGFAVATEYEGGKMQQYLQITKPFLESLPEDIWVAPGHGEMVLMRDCRNVNLTK